MRDGAGVVVGAEVRREPEWSPADLDAVEAQYVWEQSLDENGIPLDEATDPANEGRFRAGVEVTHPETGAVYRAPLTNFAQKAKLDALDAHREQYPNDNLNGKFFPVTRAPIG